MIFNKRSNADKRKAADKTAPVTLYGWRFYHPKFGWCGGYVGDVWETDRSVIENRMKHCEWPSELLTKTI